MRKDMSKVYHEPARRANRKTANARARHFARIPPDEQPAHESMCIGWRGFRRKPVCSGAPLARYLSSQVGQPWNVVYSEISRRNSLKNYAELLTREHLAHQVEQNVLMLADKPCNQSGTPLPGVQCYVDPRDGILKMVPSSHRRASIPATDAPYLTVPIDDMHAYVMVKGCWFSVTFAPLAAGSGALLPANEQDVILRLPALASRSCYINAWRKSVYACHKQQLGSRLLKRLRHQGILPPHR